MHAIVTTASAGLPAANAERSQRAVRLAAVGEDLCGLVRSVLDATWVAILWPVDRAKIEVLAVWPASKPHAHLQGDASQLHRFLRASSPIVLDNGTPVPPLLAAFATSDDEGEGATVVSPMRIGEDVGLVLVRTPCDVPVEALEQFQAVLRLGATAYDQAFEAASAVRMLAQQQQRSNEIESLLSIGRQVFHTLLDGGNTQAVLQQLSELVRKPVILYNRDFIVTSWASPTGFHGSTPPRIPIPLLTQRWFLEAVRRLTRDDPCLVLDPNPSCGLTCRHLLGRLTVHGEVAGYLGVVAIGQDIRPTERNLVELAAIALSMQQLAELLQLESEGRNQEDFLAELLRGGNAERLTRQAPLFGVDLARRHVLVRFEYQATQDADEAVSGTVRRARIVETLAAELVVGPPLAVGVPGADVLLLRIPRVDGSREALRTVKEGVATVVEQMRSWVDVHRVLISEPCEALSDYPPAHRDLFSLSELADERKWSDGVYLATELGVLRLVAAVGGSTDPVRFAAQLLRPLEDYDREHDGALTETLRAYLDAGSHIHQTAQALDVHDNTIRYRLTRIEQVLDRSITSIDDLIEFRIAFQIRGLYGGDDPNAAALAGPTPIDDPALRLVEG